jgi:MFS transporter, BCD family, chlorophyll transporter
MIPVVRRFAWIWTVLGPRFLPFADAASADLPLGRLVRLSLFQISCGMAVVLLNGTLNRVLVVEMDVSVSLVAAMVALPLVFAPLRALIGFRSDTHRSFLGWRRVPFVWTGTLLQFGGFAIMPFALLVLSGTGEGPVWVGHIGAAIAFLLVGAGLAMAQTAGLALAGDLAPADKRPRAIALLYVMLLLGTVASGAVFGWLLRDFDPMRLIQTIQGAALVTLALNVIALWKQEARDPSRTRHDAEHPDFAQAWARFSSVPGLRRLLVSVGLGTAAFGMQDILLEPYGGQVLHMSVGDTTELTALAALGALAAFAHAARRLERGADAFRLAALGLMAGIAAFSAIIFSASLESAWLFRVGAAAIGFGGGLFTVSTLTAVLTFPGTGGNGLALGAWSAVQATAAGLAIAAGGFLADAVGGLAARGALGTAMQVPAAGYTFVYHLEILLLFAALAAIGPLAGRLSGASQPTTKRFGLASYPG